METARHLVKLVGVYWLDGWLVGWLVGWLDNPVGGCLDMPQWAGPRVPKSRCSDPENAKIFGGWTWECSNLLVAWYPAIDPTVVGSGLWQDAESQNDNQSPALVNSPHSNQRMTVKESLLVEIYIYRHSVLLLISITCCYSKYFMAS